MDWINEVYEKYDQVHDNLLLNRDDYISVATLKAITGLVNEDPDHLTGTAPYVTPALLNFVDNGPQAHENYQYGEWGGGFYPVEGNYWRDAFDNNNDKKALWRWCLATQNDFAARMDWSLNSYEEANHAPIITAVNEEILVQPRQKVMLSAEAMDPDGHEAYYWWWHYPGPSGMEQVVKIFAETSNQATFTVPKDSKEDIHIILEVTDDGEPSLKRYRRLIFKMK